MSEYKKQYDSQVVVIWHNARLTKDPEVVQFGDGELVKLTSVMTSRKEGNAEVWYTIVPRKFDVGKSKYLKKGDTVSVQGFPTAREWTNKEGQTKLSHSIDQAEIIISPNMIGELKERGWVPGGDKGESLAKSTKPAKPAKTPKVAIVDPDDEDGDLI